MDHPNGSTFRSGLSTDPLVRKNQREKTDEPLQLTAQLATATTRVDAARWVDS
jgi:hypothetical protein